MEFNDVALFKELIDPISLESSLDLAPTPPISPLSSSLPILSPSLDPPESIFVEFKTFMLANPCLDHTVDDIGIERLDEHFDVKGLGLGHPTGFDFRISFVNLA